MRVAVIGAGYAGMAAAVELCSAGAIPVVYEAARALGGRARRVERDGLQLDNGQHILSGAYLELLRLMRTVGAAPEARLLRSPLALTVLPGLRLASPRLPGRLGPLVGLLMAQGLSWRDRVHALSFMRAVLSRRFHVRSGESVTALLERTSQTDATMRSLWYPLCVAALNTRPCEASAEVFANVLRDSVGAGGGRSDLLLPRVDLGRLFPDPARAYVEERGGEVRLGQRVADLSRDGHRWSVQRASYDGVVLATPPWASARLLESVEAPPELVEALKGFQYEPIYTSFLRTDPGYRLDQPMLGLSGGLVQWVFDRAQLDGLPGVFAAVVSARGPHESLTLEGFGTEAARELHAALPGSPHFEVIFTVAETRATLRCTPGLARPSDSGLAGLALAGDYTDPCYPSTLEAAVRSGVRAARRLTAAA